MKLPKDCDVIDLLYAVNSVCGHERLEDVGLNRRALRNAKKTRRWFVEEMIKAVRVRKSRLKKKFRNPQ